MPTSEKITSPEQLNDYIRVTTPGTWIILSSILVFLVGFFIWIFNGQLEVSFPSYIYTEGEKSSAFLTADKASMLQHGMTVRLSDSGESGKVLKVSDKSFSFSEISQLIGESNALAMNINDNNRLMKVELIFKNPPEKISRAVFVVDKVKPVSFLLK